MCKMFFIMISWPHLFTQFHGDDQEFVLLIYSQTD